MGIKNFIVGISTAVVTVLFLFAVLWFLTCTYSYQPYVECSFIPAIIFSPVALDLHVQVFSIVCWLVGAALLTRLLRRRRAIVVGIIGGSLFVLVAFIFLAHIVLPAFHPNS